MRSLIAGVALQAAAAGQSPGVGQVAWLEQGAIQGFKDSKISD
jgi:hypothetical protein